MKYNQNYFISFFKTQDDFANYVKNNILVGDEKTTIDDTFLATTYHAFTREYRYRIVLDQEWFYDDFDTLFLDRKRKYLILNDLWKLPNEENVEDMINAKQTTKTKNKTNDTTLQDFNTSDVDNFLGSETSVSESESTNVSKVNMIDNFTKKNLTSGIRTFVKGFEELFSKTNMRIFRNNYEYDLEEVELFDVED